MDPKQARKIAEEQGGPLATAKKGPAGGHMLSRLQREAKTDEQKALDVAAFTSSV